MLVNLVVDLLAAMDLERPDLGLGVARAAQRIIDGNDAGGVDRLAGQVAVGATVVPSIFGTDVLRVLEAPFDLQILVRIFFAPVLSGLGPVPIGLGRCIDCHPRNVAGLASHARGVGVETFVAMGLAIVAIGAMHSKKRIGVGRHALSGDAMVVSAVAVGANQPGAAHVDVDPLLGEVHRAVQVAVLHRIATSAFEMAIAAVLPGRPGDAPCRGYQVHTLLGIAGIAFDVGACLLVAYQAVDIFLAGLTGEVEGVVMPAVAGVTGGTLLDVRAGMDAEVVDQVRLTHLNLLTAAGKSGLLPGPGPVARLHDLAGGIRMTLETGPGDGRAVFERAGNQLAMIDMRRWPCDPSPGRVGGGRSSVGQSDRHGGQCGDKRQDH